jgi:hypothetical protein
MTSGNTVAELTSEANLFPDDARVLVQYPGTQQEEQGDREQWPWLPGTILERCGLDEWRVVVEVRELAERGDGSKPAPRTPEYDLYYPCCFRDSNEIRLRGTR